MWKESSIKVNGEVFHYWMKQYDKGSEWGIDGGRISKLMLKRNGKIVCNYDRGWDIKPADENTQLALELLHKRKGNCDAQAALMAVLLRRMGYEAQLVQGTFVREEGAEPVDHAWVYALVGGEGVYFDPLYGGSFAERAEDYCMASAALLKETHQWDENALQ